MSLEEKSIDSKRLNRSLTSMISSWSKLAISIGLLILSLSFTILYAQDRYDRDNLTGTASIISFIAPNAISFGLILLLLGGLLYSASYLDLFQFNFEKSIENGSSEEIYKLQSAIDSINKQLDNSTDEKITNNIKSHYDRVFREQLNEKFDEKFNKTVEDLIKDTTLKSYAPQIFREKSYSQLENFLRDLIRGIHEQIRTQQKNANFNVWLGMLFSAGGLFVMGIIVFEFVGKNLGSSSITEFLIEFTPKIAFVLIFESIAFFFLRAYREDRSMVRYLRNESTNAEMRAFGALMSVHYGSNDAREFAVRSMLKTERNFILKKGDRVIIEAVDYENPILIEALTLGLAAKLGDKLKLQPESNDASQNNTK